MITKESRKRVNLSIQPALMEKIQFFSEVDAVPIATKALEYIQQGLENEEDLYWSRMAEERAEQFEQNPTTLSFEEIWKKHIGSNLPNS